MNPPPDDSARTPRDTVRTRGLIPWQRGTSGNPLGGSISALGLAAEVRRRTKNGRQLVDFYMNLLEGRPIERAGRRPLTPNLDHMVVAANWLSDRGYGRPKETLEVTDQSSQAQRLEILRRLTDDERKQLRAILERALHHGTSAPGNDGDGTSVLPQSDEDALVLERETTADPPQSDTSNDTPT